MPKKIILSTSESAAIEAAAATKKSSNQAIDGAISTLNKQFGPNTVIKLGSHAHQSVPVFSTGNVVIDKCLGAGGIPKGRIVEIYGPESAGKSTFCLNLIAQCQKAGEVAAFIDVEHAMDPKYAKVVGVNIDELLFSQPDCGEDALNIAESLISTGAVKLVIIDSVAALVSKKELDGEMGDATMGSQARLMSQAMRRLTALTSRNMCTVIFTNQIREKIGVMFGCFPYQTSVKFADGTTELIGAVVNQKIDKPILSWNAQTGVFEAKKIKSFFKNGVDVAKFDMTDNDIAALQTKYRTFVFRYPNNAGFNKFSCTPNHILFTSQGEVNAEDLVIGDELLVQHQATKFSSDLYQLFFGSMLGDGSIRRESHTTAYFREEHSQVQKEYVKWKESALGSLNRKGSDNAHGYGISTTALPELLELRKKFYPHPHKKLKRVHAALLDELTPLSLAIWYLDDGSNPTNSPSYKNKSNAKVIYLHTINADECKEIKDFFAAKFGLDCTVKSSAKGHAARISFYGANADKFEDIIAPYVHPSMVYKLTKNVAIAGTALATLDFSTSTVDVARPCEIFEIRDKFILGKAGVRYNLEVEDNANFLLANGAIVHNSPETTSGGRALKFFASMRIDIRRKDQLKSIDGTVIGNRTKIKIVKNKIAPPFTECEFDIMFDEGISHTNSLLDMAIEGKVLDKKGAWFSFNGSLIAQGRDQLRQYVKDTPGFFGELQTALNKIAAPIPVVQGAPEHDPEHDVDPDA